MYANIETLEQVTEFDIRQSVYPNCLPAELTSEILSELGFAAIETAEQPELLPGETLQLGELRRDGDRIIRGWGVIPAAPLLATAVDAERDRRINAGFDFQGTHYQSRLPSATQAGDWDVFSGKALEAFIAVSSGAQPGDLRWADPDEDFAWIAADNSRVPMDAHTVIELARAASQHRSRHTFSGSDLKAQQPIPVDFTDDKWWQA